MVPLAAKGVIIVGGVIVAAGVALYEHEPFRNFVDDTWKKTSAALQDFADKLAPEGHRRREAPFGSESGHNRELRIRRRPRRWDQPSEKTSEETTQDNGKRDSAVDLDRDGRLAHAENVLLEADRNRDGLRRRGRDSAPSDPFADPTPEPERAVEEAQAPLVKEETPSTPTDRLEPPTPLVLTPSSHGSMTPYTPRTPAAQTPHEDTNNTVSQDYFSVSSSIQLSPSSSIERDSAQSNQSQHAELTTARLTAHNDLDHDVHQSLISVPSDSGSDAATETLSHVSVSHRDIHSQVGDDRGSSLGPGDMDEVRSVASSWSAVSSVDSRMPAPAPPNGH